MAQNPVFAVERRVLTKKKFRVRIEEPAEDRFFAACDELNRPQHAPHSKLLTWPKVEEIRKRVGGGEARSKVAAHLGISRVCAARSSRAKSGVRQFTSAGRKGDMMRLRLMAAFDAGSGAKR